MVGQERQPGLAGWAVPKTEESGDRSLRDVDAEPAQFPMNPRCAPQRIRRCHFTTMFRMDASMLGRPGCVDPERPVQRRRSHSRCQRTAVSGRTKTNARRQSRHALASTIQKSRSLVRSCGRLPVRVKAANC